MQPTKQTALTRMATRIRMGALTGIYHGRSGHPGGSLSISDLLAVLYTDELRIDPADPTREDRDRFVLSKGHCAPALYAALAERGFFSPDELTTLRHIDSRLQGHPDMKGIPGVDMSTGSLGQGISAACGMALSGKLRHKDYRVYAVVGDGESEEGQVWEAAMFAAHYKLDNLCVFFDLNGLQIDGPVTEVMNPNPHNSKLSAFGWNVLTVSAHDFEALQWALANAKKTKGKPTAVLMHSIKGKGVSFMENQCEWHGKAPNEEQYKAAMDELAKAL